MLSPDQRGDPAMCVTQLKACIHNRLQLSEVYVSSACMQLLAMSGIGLERVAALLPDVQ